MANKSQNTTPQAAQKLIDDGWQVLDVRLEKERIDGHITGSVHIRLTELSSRANELDQDRPVLIYCKSGSRAQMAADALDGVGFETVVLDGGMTAWIAAGLPYSSGSE